MHLTSILSLAVRSVLNRKATALLTVLAVAVSVMLYAGVERIRKGAQESFERTLSGADLVVGARSGPINLILYSIFHIGDASNNVTWETYQDIAQRPEIDWIIPLSLGDSHRGFRVVGTTPSFFEHYRFGDELPLEIESGAPFADVFDAVLGADVAQALQYRIGDRITLSHGVGAVSFSDHADKPFVVSGILKRTGTPVDRAVHVSLEAISAIHIGWESGGKTALARVATAERVRRMDLTPRDLTAMIVGLKSRLSVLQLQRDINTYPEEPLLAVIPGVALSQLWEVVGIVERTLSAISACVVAVGLVVILVTILTSLNERRREMAILRSVGASPGDVFFLLVAEAAALALAGSLAGLGLLYGALGVFEPLILSLTGVSLASVHPDMFDVGLVGIVVAAAALLAVFPAWRAMHNTLADGLAIRI